MSNFSAVANKPHLGAHLKYRLPSCTPSCTPLGSSSSTPVHCTSTAWEADRNVPCNMLPSKRNSCDIHSIGHPMLHLPQKSPLSDSGPCHTSVPVTLL